jgi:hypothetical protein
MKEPDRQQDHRARPTSMALRRFDISHFEAARGGNAAEDVRWAAKRSHLEDHLRLNLHAFPLSTFDCTNNM